MHYIINELKKFKNVDPNTFIPGLAMFVGCVGYLVLLIIG